jgi:hypothetical protein
MSIQSDDLIQIYNYKCKAHIFTSKAKISWSTMRPTQKIVNKREARLSLHMLTQIFVFTSNSETLKGGNQIEQA